MADKIAQIIGDVSKTRNTMELDQLVQKFTELTPLTPYDSARLEACARLIPFQYIDILRQERQNSAPGQTIRDAFADFLHRYGKHEILRGGAITAIIVLSEAGKLKQDDVQYLAEYLKREFGD